MTEPPAALIYHCHECELRFESGISDRDAEGGIRCPQCGLSNNHPVRQRDEGDFVLRRDAKFR